MYAYETVFILRADLPEAQIRESVERAKRLIEGAGGTVAEVHDWGVRDLAYPIQKQHRGYYTVIEYNAAPATVWEFERTMKIADEYLRYASVRKVVKRERKKKRMRASAPRPAREPEMDVEDMPEDM
jgi:small subunit ribosomal protein S6